MTTTVPGWTTLRAQRQSFLQQRAVWKQVLVAGQELQRSVRVAAVARRGRGCYQGGLARQRIGRELRAGLRLRGLLRFRPRRARRRRGH